MTTEEYWFWLCNIKDIHQSSIARLLEKFETPEAVYKAPEEMLVRTGAADPKRAHEISLSKNSFRSMYRLEKLAREGIRFVYYGSDLYPECLANLPDKPYALYVKGSLPDPEYPCAGIIGARMCSGYGKEMALKYSQTLAAGGVQIISGMAAGIDSYASSGAMEAGGKTFVVLGSGLDVIYPAQNIELYYQIILNGGGIISEYPMGTAPVGWQFPHRNRLISAFSDKLLVIEARQRSGTLTTVSHALAQGKDIYALPGRVTDPLSEGCNRMIADGAGILLDPSLLLEEFYGTAAARKDLFSEKLAKQTQMAGKNTDVFLSLSFEPRTVEDLAAACKKTCKETQEALTELELAGLCTMAAPNYYARA